MKKKAALFPFLLLCLLTLFGCQKKDSQNTETSTASFARSMPEAAQESISENPPVENSIYQVESFFPTMKALILCCFETGYSYSEDPWFFWTAISYELSANYQNQALNRSASKNTILMPSFVVSQCARELFPNLAELPEIPEELSNQISYHQETGDYQIKTREISFSHILFDSPEFLEDGSVKIIGKLVSSDLSTNILGQWKFTLIPNTSYNTSSSPYCILNMELLSDTIPSEVVKDVPVTFTRLEDNHTAVFTLSTGVELVLDITNDSLKVPVSDAIAGSRYLLSYYTDISTGHFILYELQER